MLSLIAQVCGVKPEDLLSEEKKKPTVKGDRKRHIIILLLSVGTVLLTAAVLWVTFSVLGFDNACPYIWWAVPLAVSVVATVFFALWFSKGLVALSVSAITWSVPLYIYKCVPIDKTGLFFAISAVFQVMIVLWFALKRIKKTPE